MLSIHATTFSSQVNFVRERVKLKLPPNPPFSPPREQANASQFQLTCTAMQSNQILIKPVHSLQESLLLAEPFDLLTRITPH